MEEEEQDVAKLSFLTFFSGDPRPAIVGIVMLAIYCLFIGAFLRTAVKIAWTSVEDRLKKVDRIYELEERASRRKESKHERDKRMKDIEKMDEIADAAAAEQVKQSATSKNTFEIVPRKKQLGSLEKWPLNTICKSSVQIFGGCKTTLKWIGNKKYNYCKQPVCC